MQEHDEVRRDYLHGSDFFKQADPEETELAFQLHSSHLPEKDTVDRVVQRYSDPLNKWISASLFYKSFIAPTHQEVLSILKEVFVKALGNVSQFTGQASISTWLFSVSYPILKSYKRNLDNFGQIANGKQSLPEYSAGSKVLENLEHIPEKLRLPLLLRYLFGFELPEIALILRLQMKEVHKRLVKVRNQLSGNVSDAHMTSQIQEYVDGLLDEDRLVPFQQHLAECEACQRSAGEITTFERTLTEELKKRWDLPKLSDRDRDELVQLINRELKGSSVSTKHQFPWQQMAWTLGFMLLFAGLAFIFIRSTPSEREFPQAARTMTPKSSVFDNSRPTETSLTKTVELHSVPFNVYPALSSDGNWAVFTEINYDPDSQSLLMPTLDLFDHQTGEILTIGDSAIKLKENSLMYYLPGISGDGRLIVFASATDARHIWGMPCRTADDLPCTDIILYNNRYNGQASRLTEEVGYGPADGDSTAPTISEDGHWVAFWSAASNLVAGNSEICQEREWISCMYLYIYDLAHGKIERLPIKQVPGWGFQVPRISLSGDGRYLGFTLTPTTLLTTLPTGSDHVLDEHGSTFYFQGSTPLLQPYVGSEAVVYDRETREYELEDQAPDGTLGDGESSSPVLSADGRFVAFVSSSTNLMQGDDNHRDDVFVRDRETGKIELISQSTDGKQGKAHSGSFVGAEPGSINITPDGRYVLFESMSPNLAPIPANELELMQSSSYSALYLRDRQTASTEVISVLPNGRSSSFPSISADGRWVTFNMSYTNCSPAQPVCQAAMLYDRQDGSLRNLTKYDQVSRVLPWSSTETVVISWRSQESSLVAITADGRQIASGGKDSQIRIVQLTAEGKLAKRTIPTMLDTVEEEFSALAYSPDSEWLAAGTVNGKVYFWRLPEGKLSFVTHDQSSLVKKIVFSQAGDYVVVSNFYDTGIYRIKDNRLSKINSISYGIAIAYAIDVTPKGDLLATSRGDGSIWLQSLPSGIVIGRVSSTQLDVSSLSFSQDGTLLAARSIDKTIDIWQINTEASITPPIKLVSTIQSYGYAGPLAFSPDNRYLAAGTEGGEVVYWSLPDEELFIVSPIFSPGVVYDMVFSPAGGRLAELLRNKIIILDTP